MRQLALLVLPLLYHVNVIWTLPSGTRRDAGHVGPPFWSRPLSLSVPDSGQDTRIFGLMLDAGSTGTRLHIYTWTNSSASTTAYPIHVHEAWSQKTGPGLSHFAGNPSHAPLTLVPLMVFAKHHIRGSRHAANTYLYLRATAGLRELRRLESSLILASVTKYLKRGCRDLGFQFMGATIISGTEEGGFAWLSVNFLTGQLQHPNATFGALDMGGSSTQIMFQPAKPPKEDAYTINLGNGTAFNPYVHTYTGYGMQAAYHRVLAYLRVWPLALLMATSVPCLPEGFTQHTLHGLLRGTGDPDACESDIQTALFPSALCMHTQCGLSGAYQPRLSGVFYAFSGFAYVAEFLRVTGEDGLGKLRHAGRKYLHYKWSHLKHRFPDVEEKYLSLYGFDALYLYRLLKGYGFGDDPHDGHRIRFGTSLASAGGAMSLGWPLGAMLFETVHLSPGRKP